jgi:menaquinone-dependent protoporphyrinogen oxidase
MGDMLVTYATAAGSTRDVATFIADVLRRRGATVRLAPAAEVTTVAGYEVVVLGSAVHDRALLPEAEAFAGRHRDALLARQVWLFSVGIGPSLRSPIGSRLGQVVPGRIAAVRDSIAARDYHAFAGVVMRRGVPLPARIALRLLGGRYGDLRDWAAIGAWAGRIPPGHS